MAQIRPVQSTCCAREDPKASTADIRIADDDIFPLVRGRARQDERVDARARIGTVEGGVHGYVGHDHGRTPDAAHADSVMCGPGPSSRASGFAPRNITFAPKKSVEPNTVSQSVTVQPRAHPGRTPPHGPVSGTRDAGRVINSYGCSFRVKVQMRGPPACRKPAAQCCTVHAPLLVCAMF